MPATYMPNKVAFGFGPILLADFADGQFINAVRNNQAVNLVIGSTGRGARAMSNDKSGTVTAILLQTSPINALLTAVAKLDEETGDGIFPLIIKDLRGLDLVKAKESWVQKHPDHGYGREIGDGNREWVFETDILDIFSGGHV